MTDRLESCLTQHPIWKHLSDNEKTLVRANSFIRQYKKGQGVFAKGAECLGMITVLAGRARAYILSDEGREVTLYRLYENDRCVLTASCVISQITFDTELVADSELELLVVSAAALSKLVKTNIHVRAMVYELISERFSTVMFAMQMILFKGFDKRLAAFLIDEYERTGEAELSMTQEAIAQHTSSAREVVARMLKRFASDGLVESKRGTIKLVDIEALEMLAE